jgi:hypothetical protein
LRRFIEAYAGLLSGTSNSISSSTMASGFLIWRSLLRSSSLKSIWAYSALEP